MSRWSKHIHDGPVNQDLVGEKVDCMEILQVGDNQQSLKLGCARCGKSFWFEDQKGGRNAVQRDGEEIHAKCPQCGCEWDGDIHSYYAIGLLLPQDEYFRQLVQSLVGGVSRKETTTAIELGVFDVVEATNAVEAMRAIVVPDDIPPKALEEGLYITKCPKAFFKQMQEAKSAKALDKHAAARGTTVADVLSKMMAGKPRFRSKTRQTANGNGNGGKDTAVSEVIDGMEQGS